MVGCYRMRGRNYQQVPAEDSRCVRCPRSLRTVTNSKETSTTEEFSRYLSIVDGKFVHCHTHNDQRMRATADEKSVANRPGFDGYLTDENGADLLPIRCLVIDS